MAKNNGNKLTKKWVCECGKAFAYAGNLEKHQKQCRAENPPPGAPDSGELSERKHVEPADRRRSAEKGAPRRVVYCPHCGTNIEALERMLEISETVPA